MDRRLRHLSARKRRPRQSSCATSLALLCFAERRVAVAQQVAGINNAFASHLVLGHADGSWLTATQVPSLHATGLQGLGQVVGLGDTGVRTDSCSFEDAAVQVPYGFASASHRKIAGYFSVGGDQQDGPDGHGTHIAGSMVGKPDSATSGQPDNGIAPAARLVVVDVEKASVPGQYKVPASNIGGSYFDLFRSAEANVVCSPWSFPEHAALDRDVDLYVWNHPEFLPIFPSGNAFAPSQAGMKPESPCVAKNALCVGASFTARQVYMEQPSLVHTVVQLGSGSCAGAARSTCAEELEAIPALFGATEPKAENSLACTAVASECLAARAACPECSFEASRLATVKDALAAASSPADACQPLTGFPSGAVCVAQRGTCTFSLKAKHCSQAGAVGVVIVNGAGQSMAVMQPTGTEAAGLNIPVVLVSNSDGLKLLASGYLLTFPAVSREVDPHNRAPYSKYGTLSDGRAKPEIIMPGDGIASTAVSASCGFVQMSGTSQSCGIAAGAAALVREYLQEWADRSLARLPQVWASTLKAVLVAAAKVERGAGSLVTPVMTPEVGFGLPALASVLPVPAGVGLVAVQSHADSTVVQRFCLALQPGGASGDHSVTLAWTDPPDSAGRLVHDLDLEVSCDVTSWQRSLGNGGLTHDRSNNVEKVSITGLSGSTSTGLCIVSVSAVGVAARSPQPFSLVAAGSFAWAPQCQSAAAPLNCVHGTAEPTSGGNGSGQWACRCSAPWVGPLCDQEPTTLDLSAHGTSLAEVGGERQLRPLQWAFFRAIPSCGAGAYEFVIEETGGKDTLETTASWGRMEVLHLPADPAALVAFEATSQSFSTGRRSTIVVQIPEEALSSAAGQAEVSLGVRSQGRDEPSAFVLRWQPGASLLAAGCGDPGGADGAAAGDGVPAEQVVLYCLLGLAGLAALVSTCVVAKRCQDRRLSYAPKSAPAPVTVHNPLTYCPQPVSGAWQGGA